jgi:deoxyribodipyrimidine photolyase-related protein
MIERIRYIPFDHLDRRRGVLKDANPATDAVILVESQRMLTGRPWNTERLFFLVSSAGPRVLQILRSSLVEGEQ